MKIVITFRSLFFLGALISLIFLLGTYVLEYGFQLEPCPLCYVQRGALFGIVVLFWLATLQNCKGNGRLIYCASIFIFSILGIVLASRHLWLQYVSPVHESNCLAGFEQMLEFMPLLEVLKETFHGSQECSKIDFTFLALPLPAWSLFSFVGFAGFSLVLGWLHIKKADLKSAFFTLHP